MNDDVFIIAEAGVNHNGSLDLALQLVDAAADTGADAVKFQTFNSASLVTSRASKAAYQQENTSAGESQLDMLRKLELSREDHLALIARCREKRIEFISTPFDIGSLELLVELGVPRLKIPSGELTNAPLLHAAARSGKPIILSTGMATLEEVRTAVSVLAHGYGPHSAAPSLQAFAASTDTEPLRGKLILLHCTTEYPSPFPDTNLRAMDTLRETFGLASGLSDHTPGISVAIAAAARGAAVIEKHMTLDRDLPGPDHKASLDPAEFTRMVTSIREVGLALGSPLKQPAPSELRNLPVVRKSLVAAKPIRAGEIFTAGNVTAKRPGGGLSPLHFWDLLGKTSPKDYQPDELLTLP